MSKLYQPPDNIKKNANVKEYDELYKKSITQREQFWEERANTLEWYKKWTKVLDDSKKPFYKWFVGAETNIIQNAIDRHLKTWRKNKLAYIWEGENGDVRTFSYHALNREVTKFANILRSMGVHKGDVVTIYMPQIPELAFAMLACAKLGAPHSVVYGGFSVEALAERIGDAKSKFLVTADGGYRRGKATKLKEIANAAMERSPTIQVCICVKRTGEPCVMDPERDFWYHDLVNLPIASQNGKTEVMSAEDPLFILYTSGSTGKPKGQIHTHGGYQVYTSTTLQYVFDLKDEDRWWCAADPGWITGHSYIVYSPLLLGATTFMYEGAPNYPYPNRWWQMIEKYGITVLYTSPTAVRGLMKYGDSWVNRHDISSLRLLGSVGEPINPAAWEWYYKVVGKEKCPIMDTWWQTETGGFMITPIPVTPLKPGSATKPFFGNDVAIVTPEGQPVKPNEEGLLVVKSPWPGMSRGILNDPDRYVSVYWKDFEKQGWYKTGDSAKVDEDGYYWIIGRVDDVIKVSGYRLGTAEIESALVSHADVAEVAAIGLPHDVKGQGIHVYAILKTGKTGSKELEHELKDWVRNEYSPVAVPEEIKFVDSLPKTRSGKIMRRVLRAQALGQPVGDLSTLDD